jgi:hypothetical protein
LLEFKSCKKKLKPANHTLPPMTPIALGDSMLDTPMTLNAEAASMESTDQDIEEVYNLDDSNDISSSQVGSQETF